MSTMMGRFNLSGGSKSATASGAPTGQSTVNPNNSFSAASMPSMQSISKSAMSISSLTKKMGAGLNIANLTGIDLEKKAKVDAEEKKNQITLALSVLEDVRLQCPSTHTGLVLAYTGTTLSPIINPGIKFTWFRMSGEDRIDQVEESLRAWYPPTVDDIGCVICAQCEDNFDQGCSRYVECGPIKADSLLCNLAESTVENGIFEAKEICVSLGLSQMESTVDDYNTLVQNHVNQVSASALSNLTTVLSKETAFLQLEGSSTIEVDETGVFISIPTFDKSAAATGAGGEFKTGRRGLRIPASTGLRVICAQPLSLILVVPITHRGVPASAPTSPAVDINGNNDETSSAGGDFSPERAAELREETRDKVAELRPALSRQTSSSATSADGSSTPTKERSLSVDSNASGATPKAPRSPAGSAHKGDKGAEEETKMKRFLTSSIVAIPWAYEGHNHSPEAYAADIDSRHASAEERERALARAEQDGIIFANTVCALAEFISALPEGTDELMLCFSCTDRLVRDALALSIRSLAAQPNGCTRYERRRVFPWLSLEDGEDAVYNEDGSGSSSSLVGASSESEQDVRRRLRAVEEESLALKRERNELTVQLLEAREEVVHLKSNGGNIGGGNNYKSQTHLSSANEEDGNNASAQLTLDKADADVSATSETQATGDTVSGLLSPGGSSGNSEAYKQLLCKVIELENKVAIDSKRESEAAKIRTDIESRNQRLLQDVDKYKRSSEDYRSKLAALQTLQDQQLKGLQRLEDDQVKRQSEIDGYKTRLKAIDGLQAQLTEKDAVIREMRFASETKDNEALAVAMKLQGLNNHVEVLQVELAAKQKEHSSAVSHLERQLSSAVMDTKRLEREILSLTERNRDLEAQLTRTKKLETDLAAAEARGDKLAGEVNHAQSKAESLGRDLKKVMRENAQSLSEFEKALIRKSEECNDLYNKINELKDDSARLAAENSVGISPREIFNKISASASSMKRESVTAWNASGEGSGTAAKSDSGGNSVSGGSNHSVSALMSTSSGNGGAGADDDGASTSPSTPRTASSSTTEQQQPAVASVAATAAAAFTGLFRQKSANL